MNSQVYLNPERLSILSIPREKVWIFASSILQLLSQEARHTPQSAFEESGSESESDDFDDSSDSDFESDVDPKMTSSFTSTQSDSKKSQITRQGSKTDNSSKNPPLWSSAESLTELNNSNDPDSETSSLESKDEFSFFHIAYTPAECTIICSQKMMGDLFRDPLSLCKKLEYEDVILIEESFLSLHVDIEGEFNNSAKILDLTKPLSQHNISLFFLSNHFSNIVLIPYKFKDQVIEILSSYDFEFSDVSNSYIMTRDSQDDQSQDVAPAPESDASFETHTFEFLRNLGVEPKIHRKTKLLLTGARPGEVKESIVKASQCIAANAVPDYFAITRSSYSEVSLILPGSSKKRAAMGFDFRSIIGSNLDAIIPMTVDLTKLPLDSTGIVAGFANSLLESMKVEKTIQDTFEMNYLSMARSAVIMIPQENLAVVTKMVKNMTK